MATLTITVIQPDLVWEDKEANLRRLEEKIESVRERTELVVLPEMFSTAFSMRVDELAETMDGPTVDWMRRLAIRRRIILTGSLIIREGGHFFNRLIWMLPNGQCGYYDKRHRFAYAGEDERYTAGSRRMIASVNGWRVNLQICYDLRFPVWSRQQTGSSGMTDSQRTTDPADAATERKPEYDLLLYVANWPERRNHAWKTLLQARAIENQAYVVGVNRVGSDGNRIYHSGDSMIVDPLGTVLFQAEKEEVVHTQVLEKEKLDEIRKNFPFWRDADHFTIEQS